MKKRAYYDIGKGDAGSGEAGASLNGYYSSGIQLVGPDRKG